METASSVFLSGMSLRDRGASGGKKWAAALPRLSREAGSLGTVERCWASRVPGLRPVLSSVETAMADTTPGCRSCYTYSSTFGISTHGGPIQAANFILSHKGMANKIIYYHRPFIKGRILFF